MELGFRLVDFRSTGHNHNSAISPLTEKVLDYLLDNYLRPATLPPSSSSDWGKGRNREQSALETSWPSDWAFTRRTFKAAVAKFDRATQTVRDLVDSPTSETVQRSSVPPEFLPVTQNYNSSKHEVPDRNSPTSIENSGFDRLAAVIRDETRELPPSLQSQSSETTPLSQSPNPDYTTEGQTTSLEPEGDHTNLDQKRDGEPPTIQVSPDQSSQHTAILESPKTPPNAPKGKAKAFPPPPLQPFNAQDYAKKLQKAANMNTQPFGPGPSGRGTGAFGLPSGFGAMPSTVAGAPTAPSSSQAPPNFGTETVRDATAHTGKQQLDASIADAIQKSVTEAIIALEQRKNNSNAQHRDNNHLNNNEREDNNSSTGRTSYGQLRVSDVGFLWPDMPESYGPGDVVFTHRETLYREVYTFCRRIEDLAATKGEDLVRENIANCFRGTALHWWLNTLSQDERDALQQLPTGLKRIISRLQDRFKLPMSTALVRLGEQTYNLHDANARKDPAGYVQTVSRLALQAGINDEQAQCTWAWNHLDVELQKTVPPPGPETTIRSFSDLLDARKEMWHRISEHNEIRETKRDSKETRESKGKDRGPVQQRDRDFQGGYSRPNQAAGRTFQSSQPPPGVRYGYDSRQYDYRPYNPRPPYPTYPTYGQSFPHIGPYAYQQQFMPPQVYSNTTTQTYQTQPASVPPPKDQLALQAPPQQKLIEGPRDQGQRNTQNPGDGSGDQNRGSTRPSNFSSRNPYSTQNNSNRPPYNGGYSAGGMMRYAPRPFQQPQPVYFGDPYQEANVYYGVPQDHADYYPDFQTNTMTDAAGDNTSEFQQDATAYMAENVPPEDRETVNDVADVNFAVVAYNVDNETTRKTFCRKCNVSFKSRNQLHKHIRNKACKSKTANTLPNDERRSATEQGSDVGQAPDVPDIVESVGSYQAKIIESSIRPTPSGHLEFRTWHYLKVKFTGDPKLATTEVCADTGCNMSMMDKDFFTQYFPNAVVRKISEPVTLRGIGKNRHIACEYTTIIFYLKGSPDQNGLHKWLKFHKAFYIVDALSAQVLLGMDFIGTEGAIIDLPKRQISFESCRNEAVEASAVPIDQKRIKRAVKVSSTTTLPPHSSAAVPVKLNGKSKLPDRHYFFDPSVPALMSHFVDADFDFIHAENPTDKPITFHRHQKLGTVLDLSSPEVNFSTASELEAVVENRSPLSELEEPAIPLTKISVDPNLETKLPNGITIYGDDNQVKAIKEVLCRYPRIWEDNGNLVDVPEENWLTIPLTSDWRESKFKINQKVYPLSEDARKVVDDVFDKMHAQGKMSFTTGPTPFAFPVFVVFKTIYEGPDRIPKQKGRPVIDIRGLNSRTVRDGYPLPTQDSIVAEIGGCMYITAVDGSGMFHQFRVSVKDRHKFTVISHRGSEYFNVVAMGFKNSVPYVQRIMDEILREYREFARCYIDDIVIFSKTLDDHIEHLDKVFALLSQIGLALEAKKSFIGYPSVRLLGRKVDAFGLSTSEDRVAAIRELAFPNTLDRLEAYLGLANYLRSNIRYFAQLSEPLQQRKTVLVKNSPSKGGKERKKYAQRTEFEPTEAESLSFSALQKALTSETYLHHFNKNRRLYIDLDASKVYGFGVMVHHVRGDPDTYAYNAADVEPIVFLSKLLNTAETHYWSTELEVAALV